MALSQQEFEKLKARLSSSSVVTPTQSGGYSLSETIQDIKQTGSNLFNTAKETGKKVISATNASGQGQKETMFQVGGALAGGVSQAIGDVFTGGAKVALTQGGEDIIKRGVAGAVKPLTETDALKSIMDKYNTLPDRVKRDIDATLGLGSLALDVYGVGLAKKPVTDVVKAGKEAITTGLKAGEELTTNLPRATERLITMTKEGITPTISREKAIGEVLQGTTQDIKKGTAGLSLIDTKGIKTYQKLNEAIDNKIPELAKVVDNEFAQDTTKTLLDDLKIVKPTKAGGEVSINYVDNALKQLDELYEKTGDAVAQADIKDLINTAKTEGLNKLEINDIARTYGQEFGEKAFGKIGEPLTSVNAQMYENTRKGVKEVARSGLVSDVAKKADEAMSKLYNTRALVKKNVEAVNKLMNRIEERGLIEKIGYNVSKYADILTGGSLRGFVGGILPRGAGYKTLNALDLEALLERNLKIINEATKAKTPSQFKDITSQLLDRKSSSKNTLTNVPKNTNQVTTTGKNINANSMNSNIIPKSIPPNKKSSQAGFISTGGKDLQPLYKEAQGKSMEEFVKGRKDIVYRGEGGSNVAQGKSLLADGKHFASDSEYPKGFGKVSEYVLKPNTKVLDLGDSTFAEISNKLGIPERRYISPSELSKIAKDKGYGVLKYDGEYASTGKSFKHTVDLTGDSYITKSQLEQIWKEANAKTSTKQGMTVINPLTAIAGSSAIGAGAISIKNKKK